MNRGSDSGPRRVLASADRFNEAPIHESGKFAFARIVCFPTRRFNEAPIHESGKSDTRRQ